MNGSALPDKHQTTWQLVAIQLSGWISMPVLATSLLLLEINSFLGAVLTIIVGNAILWFIRLGIVSMSADKRQSTLDISKEYLGVGGGYFIALLLLFSTLSWYIVQTTSASNTLTQLIQFKERPDIDQFIQVSVFLGIISTVLCMEGIVLLKRIALVSFPIMIALFLAMIFLLPHQISYENSRPLSLAGLSLVLATNLGITSDLPTFFRHSQSWLTSVKALTIVQLVSLGLAIFSLYFGSILNIGFQINDHMLLSDNNHLLRNLLILFVFISVICANVANVYSASVGWEVIAPKGLIGRKEYLILGLGLVTIFILVSNIFSLQYLLNVSDSALVNLCIILIIGYMISLKTKKPPNPFQQGTYFTAWLLSSLFSFIQYAGIYPLPISPFIGSLLIIFSILILSSLLSNRINFAR